MTPDSGSSRPSIIHVTTVAMTLRFLTGQIGFMRKQGLHVAALSSPGPELEAFGRSESIPVHAVEMPRRITPLQDLVAMGRLWHRLRQLRPDIVHAHTPKAGLLATVAGWLARVPIRVYHIHGLPVLTATGAKRRLLSWSERVACRLATQVLCVSWSVRAEAVALDLCPAERIKVLANGTVNGLAADSRFDPNAVPAGTRERVRERYGIPVDALVMGFVGRIVRDKGLIELVRSWRDLRMQYPAMHLLVVGPFEPQDPLPAEVATALRTDPRVHLVGPDWNTPPLYAAMDVFVLPTYREGFCTVLLEAGAMELPVVATRVPGCTDAVVDGVTGVLVPAGDAGALCDAIALYLADPDRRRLDGQAGRKRVLRDFQQEVVWAAMLAEYRRLLHAAGQPLPIPECAGEEMACEVA